jgi:signal transduction histidine kinase
MTATNPQETTPSAIAGQVRALATWLDPGEPSLLRGPFARWPRTTDGVLVLAVLAASLIAVALSALDEDKDLTFASIGDRPAGVIAVLAVAAAALWWRRARPVEVTATVLALMMVWAIAGYGDGQDLALVVAVYSVGRHATDHLRSLTIVAAAIAVGIAGTVIDTHQRIDVLPAVLLTVLPWYVGRRVRNRGDYLALLRDRNERLEAEQLARARQAVADERSRIARELHDVVAHQVSMMTVQAGAAKTIARHDLGAAVEAMGDVEQAGRQALGELRHLLGVLRADASEPDRLGPLPGLSDVPALVERLTQTGAEVTLSVTGLPGHLATAVDLSAYRIIQESVTNIIKHAGSDPIVDITVTTGDHQLLIDITNTTDTTSPRLPASGFGIAGMGERATLLGGTLAAGPESPDRFGVHARLPLEPEPT